MMAFPANIIQMDRAFLLSRNSLNFYRSSFSLNSKLKPINCKPSYSWQKRWISRFSTNFQQPNFREFKDFLQKPESNIAPIKTEITSNPPPYLVNKDYTGNGRKVYLETYGCQMNFSDMEIVRSVLVNNDFLECKSVSDADVVLIMTCAIRDGAEQKIRNRLHRLKKTKKYQKQKKKNFTVGVLGCMAERLKEKLLIEESCVDLIAGPDSYRD